MHFSLQYMQVPQVGLLGLEPTCSTSLVWILPWCGAYNFLGVDSWVWSLQDPWSRCGAYNFLGVDSWVWSLQLPWCGFLGVEPTGSFLKLWSLQLPWCAFIGVNPTTSLVWSQWSLQLDWCESYNFLGVVPVEPTTGVHPTTSLVWSFLAWCGAYNLIGVHPTTSLVWRLCVEPTIDFIGVEPLSVEPTTSLVWRCGAFIDSKFQLGGVVGACSASQVLHVGLYVLNT